MTDAIRHAFVRFARQVDGDARDHVAEAVMAICVVGEERRRPAIAPNTGQSATKLHIITVRLGDMGQ